MYVLDENNVEFSLEKLRNCFLLDAYRVLICQKKVLPNYEKTFLVPKDKFILFSRSDFYIQKISLPKNFESTDDRIYLIENIIAEFCCSCSEICEQDWWLYASNYNSSTPRIIAGIGKGIMLSRFLPNGSNMSDEISKTIMYMLRFGLKKSIKIFSSLRKIEIHPKIGEKISCQKIIIDECGNAIINNFASSTKPIITNNKIYFRKFVNNKILLIMLLAVIFIFSKINQFILDNEKIISSLEKNTHIKTEHIELEVNSENFFKTKQFISTLQNLQNPLKLFQKASEICRKYNLPVEELSFENDNLIKVKTTINKNIFNQLKSINYIEIEKRSNDEYEELGSNKKLGVVVCIK